MLVVNRDAAVLFDDDAIRSFAGKPVTMQHPMAMVSPANFRDSEVGVVLNPRRGDGIDADYLIADLLIKDQEAIDAIRKGMREVSCGYDCEYEQVSPGTGRQVKIVGNHVALVDRGRCGPSCSIGDAEMASVTSTRPVKRGLLASVMRMAFNSKDEKAFDAALALVDEEDPEDEKEKEKREKEKEEEAKDAKMKDSIATLIKDAVSASIAPLADRIAKLEKDAEKEDEDDPDDDEDEDKKGEAKDRRTKDRKPTRDSAPLEAEWQDTVAKAEMLLPGSKIAATFDAAAPVAQTTEMLCAFRKTVLKDAKRDEKRRLFVDKAVGRYAIDKLPCESVNIAFDAAAELARAANNSLANPKGGNGDAATAARVRTAADMQKLVEQSRKHWGRQA